MIKNSIHPILLFIHPFSFFFIYFFFIYFCCCCYLIDRPENRKGAVIFQLGPCIQHRFQLWDCGEGAASPIAVC